MDAASSRWWVVVPVKHADRAKTRLVPPRYVSRARLARAMARDTLEAVCGAVPAGRVVTVTDDPVVRQAAVRLGAAVEPDPGGGLNEAVAAGAARVGRGPVEREGAHLGVLLGDLPALRPGDLASALALCARHRRAAVPDAEGTGTVLLTAAPDADLRPAFGAGSAARHAVGATLVLPDLPRLRRDVDDAHTLAVAAALGLGPHTRAALGRRLADMQGSVHTFDPLTDTGSVLLDTGRVVPFDAEAFAASTLRHLRVGQRLSLDLTADPEEDAVRVRRLWIVGIGPGEAIR